MNPRRSSSIGHDMLGFVWAKVFSVVVTARLRISGCCPVGPGMTSPLRYFLPPRAGRSHATRSTTFN